MLVQINNLKTHIRTERGIIRAVDGVSFGIDEGETLCLAGESGSGKSLTALSIMQLLPADNFFHPTGEILYRPAKEQPAIDILKINDDEKRALRGAHIGMVFQEPMTSLNPVFTIGEQIDEILQWYYPKTSSAERRERIIGALAQVQIAAPAEKIDAYPHELSGGPRIGPANA